MAGDITDVVPGTPEAVALADEMEFVLTSVEDFLGRLTLTGDPLVEGGMLLRSVEAFNRKLGIDPPLES